MTACKADKEPVSSNNNVNSEVNISSEESVFSEESTPPSNDVSSEEINSANTSDPTEEYVTSEPSEEYTEYRSLTILGDSIASGCMLPQYEPGNNFSAPLSFGNMLGSEFESYQNFAVDGRTTAELLDALKSSEELTEALLDSDVVVISIGGNDFLQPMISAMMSDSELIATLYAQEYQPDMSDENIQKILSSAFEAAQNVDVKNMLDNISECVKLISEVNPDTEIILMTVYNPFSRNELLNAASEAAQEQLSLLNFGITLLQGGKVSVIDVHSAFDGKAGKYTNIGIMDIHPNTEDHNKIYELLKKQLEIGN